MTGLLPATEVYARSLRWEIVFSRQLGGQTLYRLRGLDCAPCGWALSLVSYFRVVADRSQLPSSATIVGLYPGQSPMIRGIRKNQ